MRTRAVALTILLAFLAAANRAQAQGMSPRDLWPQATAAAADGDFDTAEKKTTELLGTGRTYGIRTFPLYASAAAGLASEAGRGQPDLARWATRTAASLDSRSPAVAFSEADRAVRSNDWAAAIPMALQGFLRSAGNYRSSLLARADLLLVAAIAIVVTALVFGIALFVRYGRSMAHDFRELLSLRLRGGSVSVLAFALLFLPLFLWLGPVWLIFYWFAIFFGYAGIGERIAIAVLLLLVAALPLAVDTAADRIARVDGPVVTAALSSVTQGYQPEVLRRLQDLIAVVPDEPMLHLLLGNLLCFEGMDDQAGAEYRRAVELRANYAGAHVNIGNLLFLNGDFQAAITEYEKAERTDSSLAIAFYNHSVAAGETFKYDQQALMLRKAGEADRSFVDRVRKSQPPQKIVMYSPSIEEAWQVDRRVSAIAAAHSQFGNYSTFELTRRLANPVTLGAIVSLLLALALWSFRRKAGFANACIKCGRTFCYRCKSSRESATYCTQCIHIYLKRDGVSLDTKRKKLEEVGDYLTSMSRRNRLFATFLPGSAQVLEGRVATGAAGIFFFALFVATAILIGRLAPTLGPAAHIAQLLVRGGSILLALIVWLLLSLPVYRRRVAA